MEDHKNKVFVMGDIHGAYQALIKCLVRSNFNYETDTLIQLGDVVDGNQDVFECVEELLKIKKLIAIKGNHDVWFQQFLDSDFQPQSWNHGGIATLESYLRHCQPNGKIIKTGKGYKTSLNATDIPKNHKSFFERQRLYYLDNHNRCFVHAGFDPSIPFHGQDETNYYLDRNLWLKAFSLQKQRCNKTSLTTFSEIYIGHTATTRWNITLPIKALEIINLDTGAGHNGKLTIMDLNSNEYWQSELI
ncbi:MAG: metallophosphoesterase [Sphingobacterium sp.]|jgi:serine/threonine protein phosphatase 1|uniref:metallophosphoesterase n=1 Tax=Sphingobacterium sp. TaxID=341027 RepID=UPI00284CCACB|nr:metallophosphoesterase [Sphingobacterium sp.]MDR3008656.1 metallophosphoesterase [Sphingobacterium sp.]